MAMQAAIARRFAGLGPKDLPEGMIILSMAADTRAPEALKDIWIDLHGQKPEDALSDQLLEVAPFLVAFCDVFDDEQLAALSQLLNWLDTSEAGTPIALLPVFMRPPAEDDTRSVNELLKGILSSYLDDVIAGEAAGFALAFAIHASLTRAEAKVQKWMDTFRERTCRTREVRMLRSGLDATLWQYVPQRLHIPLPAVDYNMNDHDGRHFAGYAIRRRLAFCADQLVYEVDPPAGTTAAPQGEVVKIVPKSAVQKTIDSVRRVQRTWQILQTLSGRWAHPNIIRSYQIYHSPTSIYMRMEHWGSESLYHRLKARGSGNRAMSASQLQCLVTQMTDVINHLHTGPRICHRDIKPENFAVTEADGQISLKLVNFDTAAVQRPGGRCKLKSGTFPFVAPEVAHHKYDGMAADMWSMGIVLLEIACGIRIIERSLLDKSANDGKAIEVQSKGFPRKAVQRVRDAFMDEGLVERMLSASAVPELAPWQAPFAAVVQNLLQVTPTQRWSSEQVVDAFSELFAQAAVNDQREDTAAAPADAFA